MEDILLPVIMAAIITLASIAMAKILQGIDSSGTKERRSGPSHTQNPEAKRS